MRSAVAVTPGLSVRPPRLKTADHLVVAHIPGEENESVLPRRRCYESVGDEESVAEEERLHQFEGDGGDAAFSAWRFRFGRTPEGRPLRA